MDKATTDALNVAAASLGAPAAWLYSLIDFESNWNPQRRATLPYNLATIKKTPGTPPKYARGLIQFTDETAQGLGFKDSTDLITKYPSADKQLLTPVVNYLSHYKPFPTKQALYMAVFYPVARTWPAFQTMPDSVKIANPGINNVQDYIDLVESHGIKKKVKTGAGIALVLGAIGVLLYKLLK